MARADAAADPFGFRRMARRTRPAAGFPRRWRSWASSYRLANHPWKPSSWIISKRRRRTTDALSREGPGYASRAKSVSGPGAPAHRAVYGWRGSRLGGSDQNPYRARVRHLLSLPLIRAGRPGSDARSVPARVPVAQEFSRRGRVVHDM